MANKKVKATINVKEMLKNKFTPNGKVLKMVDGRTNFAKATNEFLKHAELIKKGTGELSDSKAKCKDRLNSAENALALYKKGSVINSEELARLENVLVEIKEEHKELDKAIRGYMPKLTVADANLYVAYYWYQTEPQKESYDGEFEVLYKRAFMEWFDSFGMAMGKKDYSFFTTKLGLKKAGNKVYRESNATKLTKELGCKEFIELLYRIIIELMIKKGLINPYTFTYTSPVQGDESVEKPEPESVPVEDKKEEKPVA